MIIGFYILKLLLAIALLTLAIGLRLPLFAEVRTGLFWAVLLFSLSLFVFELVRVKQKTNLAKILSVLVLVTAFSGFSAILISEFRFNQLKQQIFNADSNVLAELGQHFIIGYRDLDEIEKLINYKAINGIFITARNVKDRSKAEIAQEIERLQEIRRQQELPPLWVAADQEGGLVSRLSPPLTQLSSLSKVVESQPDLKQRQIAIAQYAQTHGKELAELGVNLNFAPVVDLNKGIVNLSDRFSQIYRRAISSDKDVVAQVALQYCKTLESYGVYCTIKHFPGLGRVATDTHVAEAELTTSVAELAEDDWVPFRSVLKQSQALMMVGHAKLVAVDRDRPVSFSKSAITGIIRDKWQHNGVLVTDDFCMQAVYGSAAGLTGATVEALNAGVDLILISFDPDVYYRSMQALLKAHEEKRLDPSLLKQSRQRLATYASR